MTDLFQVIRLSPSFRWVFRSECRSNGFSPRDGPSHGEEKIGLHWLVNGRALVERKDFRRRETSIIFLQLSVYFEDCSPIMSNVYIKTL